MQYLTNFRNTISAAQKRASQFTDTAIQAESEGRYQTAAYWRARAAHKMAEVEAMLQVVDGL